MTLFLHQREDALQWIRRGLFWTLLTLALMLAWPGSVFAAHSGIFESGRLNPRALLQAGGLIGYLTIALSVAMVAMMIEHLLSIRRETLLPQSLAVDLQKQLTAGQVGQAEQTCRQRPCLLSAIVLAGLQSLQFGYEAAEKAMEDTAQEYAARLARKVDYLSVIGAIAPMMGLTGTVWGMIQAFAQFAEQANPSPSDFAPSISEALVTTLFGLVVAIPAMSAHAWFRNRTDEFVAEAALLSERLMSTQRKRRRVESTPEIPKAKL
ncbi:MotA/TolQ/ExbB proton channel family protein [Planctomicrobium piriforme]|uniref:Biopolymer transport protein ExbB n=1 Tax=Planctomicrobium piriforme TaxID=1576369 RepID=A0A1I3B2B8_9PLAN|nr:MotA/TolQ/ExbB proton channel family protein [Planctomicrobium piriforme]SFH56457.1 biopolymer transport protein ExbB [Planctomicrobium piriforme]